MKTLIADSGSTKCDWAMLNEEGKVFDSWSTMGFNPYFHSSDFVKDTISQHKMGTYKDDVGAIYFYGAGCSSVDLNHIIQRGLERAFPKAKVTVDHDVLGAAYATYTGEPAITCILGTGSNSAFFDGANVSEEVPSLAYIVGDESSGSYYGKELVKAYFYKKLAPDLREDFEKQYNLNKDSFIKRVYNEPHANVYLASFMKFLGKHPKHPQIVRWLKEGMAEFVDIHVECFDECKEVPVHFIGSVAYYFSDILKGVLEERGLSLGQIIKKPIDGLVKYHTEYIIA